MLADRKSMFCRRRFLQFVAASPLFAYTEGDATVQANRNGFTRFQIRARRLVDTTKIDMSTRLFETTWPVPIFKLTSASTTWVAGCSGLWLDSCGGMEGYCRSALPVERCRLSP